MKYIAPSYIILPVSELKDSHFSVVEQQRASVRLSVDKKLALLSFRGPLPKLLAKYRVLSQSRARRILSSCVWNPAIPATFWAKVWSILCKFL